MSKEPLLSQCSCEHASECTCAGPTIGDIPMHLRPRRWDLLSNRAHLYDQQVHIERWCQQRHQGRLGVLVWILISALPALSLILILSTWTWEIYDVDADVALEIIRIEVLIIAIVVLLILMGEMRL